MCLISFLPHILDDMAAGRKTKYKLLKSVAKEYRGKIDFVWIEGGAQPELEAALNLGFGFPAAVLINCANHCAHSQPLDCCFTSGPRLTCTDGGASLSVLLQRKSRFTLSPQPLLTSVASSHLWKGC